MKDRTWITSGTLVLIAFWTVLVLSAREHALWKSSFRDYFVLEDARVDRDIAILNDRRFASAFCLYSVCLIGFVPLALQKVFHRLSLAVAALAVLFIPCIWYGARVVHVSGKLVDWAAVFRNTP